MKADEKRLGRIVREEYLEHMEYSVWAGSDKRPLPEASQQVYGFTVEPGEEVQIRQEHCKLTGKLIVNLYRVKSN